VRLQLELLKPQMLLDEYGVESTVVLFGGARIPRLPAKDSAASETLADLSQYYEEARRFAYLVTQASLESGGHRNIITTGGGPGVMEAGNRGAREAGGISIGLNIVLPHEQAPNEYVTPDLCFNFHYFAIRKMHFLMRANAVCVFPGRFRHAGRDVRGPDPDPDGPDEAGALPAVRARLLGKDHQLGGAGRGGHHLDRIIPPPMRESRRWNCVSAQLRRFAGNTT
jgi:predicted Rossmann-fold nucleotide-binding protein